MGAAAGSTVFIPPITDDESIDGGAGGLPGGGMLGGATVIGATVGFAGVGFDCGFGAGGVGGVLTGTSPILVVGGSCAGFPGLPC